jgi:hypothetical protein
MKRETVETLKEGAGMLFFCATLYAGWILVCAVSA